MTTRQLRLLPGGLTAFLFCVHLASADTLLVTHWARGVQPGEVVLLEVTAPEPLVSVEATYLNRSFTLFPDVSSPGRWFGLLGIDLEAKTGPAQVIVSAQTSQGARRTEYALPVRPKEFPVRRLQVDDKYVSPPPEVQARIERESRLVAAIFKDRGKSRRWEGAFARPVPGAAISSFGKRNILNGQPRSPHSGTDFQAASGTPIKAPNHGRVRLAQDLYFAGNSVIIDHGQGLYTYFAHLSEFAVEEGQEVKKGELVGKVGATGRVTGPHLHWTSRLSEARVDPLSLMAVLEHLENRGVR